MRTGNLEAYVACFMPEAQSEVEARFEGKSQDEIRKTLLMEIAIVGALRLNKSEILADGSVGFPVSSVEVDNGLSVTKQQKVFRFRNVGGEWKFSN